MVVRVEVLVRERVGDQHRHPAVVEEAGVVATVLDGMVVGVHGAEVQPVLLGAASENLDQLVGAVLVHVIVNVDAVVLTLAVADHVHLDHRDLLEVLLLDRVGVGVAAVQPLLLAREVDEADGAVVVGLGQELCELHHADGAGAIVIGARGNRFRSPRPASRRVEVGAGDEALARRHLAGNLDHQVVKLGAAALVLVTERLQSEACVERLQILDSGLELAEVAVPAGDLLRLAGERERLLTSEVAQSCFDHADVDRAQQRSDLGVGGRQVRVVDRVDDVRGLALFNLVVLAAVVVNLAGVLGAQRRRLVIVLPDPPTDDGGDGRDSKNQGDEPFDAKHVHGISPFCVRQPPRSSRLESTATWWLISTGFVRYFSGLT